MSRGIAIVAIGLLLALPLAVSAQTRPAKSGDKVKPKKLYCWNEGTERICSDALPPEAVDRAREEFSASSGLRNKQVDRALSDDERAVAASDAAQRRLDEMAEQTRQRTEQAMLSTYSGEEDLRRVFSERVGILDNNIQTARYNVASLRDALVTLLSSAGDRELSGGKVTDTQAQTIRGRHSQLQAQLRLQASFEQQRQALEGEIQETLQRYRTLKGLDAAPAETTGG